MCLIGIKQCGRPPTVSNALEQRRSYQSVNANPGDSVTYRCTNGYAFVGSDTVTCLDNGQWSSPPSCRASLAGVSCGQAPQLRNGRISQQSFGQGSTSSEGDSVSYSCDQGYSLQGFGTITCGSNGVWTLLPQCVQSRQQSCGNPPSLANGRIVRQSGSAPGDTVEYTCTTGYTMNGNSIISCDRIAIQWTQMPVCSSSPQTCGAPPNLFNGRVISQSFPRGSQSSGGDTITYDCNTGYALVGNSVVTCDRFTGRWSGVPICQRKF